MEFEYPFPPQGAAAAASDFATPSLPTAIQEQWGLRVVPGKGPFNLVVVENAQMPTAN